MLYDVALIMGECPLRDKELLIAATVQAIRSMIFRAKQQNIPIDNHKLADKLERMGSDLPETLADDIKVLWNDEGIVKSYLMNPDQDVK